MELKRCTVRHPLLQKLVKFFWVVDYQDNISIDHSLLPVGNIDIILNFSAPMTYFTGGKSENSPVQAPRGFHLAGLRDRPYRVVQRGCVDSIGISFYPYGLFPFLKVPMSEFTNRTVELELIDRGFTRELRDRLAGCVSVREKLDIIESALLRTLDSGLMADRCTGILFNAFLACTGEMNIERFCGVHGVNKRKLERLFNKYIGISPKLFHRINRFTGIVNKIIDKDYDSLTTMAVNADYYDQTHFIKDFKALAGCPPSRFMSRKTSIKDIIEYL